MGGRRDDPAPKVWSGFQTAEHAPGTLRYGEGILPVLARSEAEAMTIARAYYAQKQRVNRGWCVDVDLEFLEIGVDVERGT